MMDLVLNHTARDSRIVQEHPGWYARDAQGEIRSPSAIDPADARNITVWGAAVDTLENTSRFAEGKPTGPMAVFHLFDSPLTMSRPYESYMGCLTIPKQVAETAASTTGRGGTAPVSSGPEARAAPVTAIAIPTQAVALGCSPARRPRNTGTRAPNDEIGATTPIVPAASAV